MNILKEVLRNEVQEALGCTEPGAVAYACSLAVKSLKDEAAERYAGNLSIFNLIVEMTPGVYKNAQGVSIPFSDGKKGIEIAAALGSYGDSALGLGVLGEIHPADRLKAEQLVNGNQVRVKVNSEWQQSFRIVVTVESSVGRAVVVIEDSHTNVVEITINGISVGGNHSSDKNQPPGSTEADYGQKLACLSIGDMVLLAQDIDGPDRQYLLAGVVMNRQLAYAGLAMGKFGSQLRTMVEEKILTDDIITSTKILTAGATDARMAGVDLPAMSSGCSGNQGIVAILVPHNVGIRRGVDLDRIIESIALSHLLNAFVKQFTGKIAPICGCSVSAGLGAATAIAYQTTFDVGVIGSAINNLVADIAGVICDGAKSGCSLKVITATDSAIRSAIFAINGVSVSGGFDGIISQQAEQTIKNLGRINSEGMSGVDRTVLDIMDPRRRKF